MINKCIRFFAALIICIVTLLCSCVVVSASDAQLYLSDAEAKKNRLVDVTLYAQSIDDVAAFTAELTFDDMALEYRGVSVLIEDMQSEVNSSEKGHIKAVFLCEESVACSKGTPLVTFSFKALCEGNHEVSLEVSDLIDSKYNSKTARSKSGFVSVAAAPVNEQVADSYEDETSKSDSAHTMTILSEDTYTQQNETEVGKSEDKSAVFFVIMAVLALLSVVGFVSYKIGSKASVKRKDDKG